MHGVWRMESCKDNYAKSTRCFYCSSDKHSVKSHQCQKEECQDESQSCPHPPKCILCNGLHNADYTDCPLKSSYSKAKGTLIKATAAEVASIRGQQKVLRNRLIRDNLFQAELARQTQARTSSCTTLNSSSSNQ